MCIKLWRVSDSKMDLCGLCTYATPSTGGSHDREPQHLHRPAGQNDDVMSSFCLGGRWHASDLFDEACAVKKAAESSRSTHHGILKFDSCQATATYILGKTRASALQLGCIVYK